MEQYRSARRFGISVVLLTLLFRMFEQGLPQRVIRQIAVQAPDMLSDTETGQENVRSLSVEAFAPFPVESAPPEPVVIRAPIPVFTTADADAIAFTNTGREAPDIAALLTAPLELQLAGEQPTVLILHSHTTESYAKNGEAYQESAAYRTLDEGYNMLSIGDRVTERLESEGIRVIHDREFHDYPSYTGAYNHARKSLQAFLHDNPQVQLVLDLHRDAADGSHQLKTHALRDGRDSSQLMLVLGTGNSGLPNPSWEQNTALALKLQTLLQQQCPGICRPLSLRGQRFNQDLGPATVLVEVGAAGDTHDQALQAAEALADAIIALKNGAITLQ